MKHKMKHGRLPNLKHLFSVAVLIASGSAQAVLGGSADTLPAEAKAATARYMKSASVGESTVHQLVSSSRTVKEYTNAQGVVYAVTWSGGTQPNLSSLFGSYYTEFHDQKVKSLRRHGVRSSAVNSANLRVLTWGLQRSMKGCATLTSAIPASVKVADICGGVK